jgi:hypothetical protein
VLAVGLLLFIWRRVVEDREGVHLREETPTMPPTSETRAATTPAT